MSAKKNADFEPVSKSKLADELAERLVGLIRSGTYKAGDRLPPIADMARSFGVGHPSLREALKKLEGVGIVKMKHGSGVYVGDGHNALLLSNPMFIGVATQKLLADLITARIPIETTAAGLAALEASDEHLAEMERMLDHAGRHLNDDAILNAANMGFHRQIAAASGNAVLAQLLEVLTDHFQNEQRMILDIHGSRESDHREHRAILTALKNRDAELAETRMQEHLNGVLAAVLRWDGSTDAPVSA